MTNKSTYIPDPPEPRVPGIHNIPDAPAKPSRKKVTYNIKEILRRKYEEINLGDPYTQLMGMPEPKFVAMFYGPPGAGKSVFAIQFANHFAKHFGKVFYNSHEERIKKTLRDRIKDYGIDADKRIQFGDAVPFHQMMEMNRKNHYRLIIIDSIQYMQLTYSQLQEMQAEFKKRLLSLVMLSFGESWGKPDNARHHLYASDIKGYFYLNEVGTYGMCRFASRYKKTIVNAELFKIKHEILNLVANEDEAQTQPIL